MMSLPQGFTRQRLLWLIGNWPDPKKYGTPQYWAREEWFAALCNRYRGANDHNASDSDIFQVYCSLRYKRKAGDSELRCPLDPSRRKSFPRPEVTEAQKQEIYRLYRKHKLGLDRYALSLELDRDLVEFNRETGSGWGPLSYWRVLYYLSKRDRNFPSKKKDPFRNSRKALVKKTAPALKGFGDLP